RQQPDVDAAGAQRPLALAPGVDHGAVRDAEDPHVGDCPPAGVGSRMNPPISPRPSAPSRWRPATAARPGPPRPPTTQEATCATPRPPPPRPPKPPARG